MTKMTEKSVIVKKTLDTRTAALFVQTASKFESMVKVSLDDKIVNAKSLMCIISLGINPDTEIKITADGADEKMAVDEVAGILE